MEGFVLNASSRDQVGKGPAGRLRKEGLFPAILYGAEIKDNIKLTINALELEKLVHKGLRRTSLVDLIIDDSKEARRVMFKDVSRDPVRRDFVHADLFEISLDHKISLDVPIHLVGKCRGVADGGGVLQENLRALKITCLPDAIPASFEIDITDIDVGGAVHVGDVALPEGVEALQDDSLTVLTVMLPRVRSDDNEEGEEGEEGAEGVETEEGAEE